MAGAAPTETRRVQQNQPKEAGKVLQFVPQEEATWRDRVAEEAGRVDPSFRSEHAIPAAVQPIQESKTGVHVQAGVNAEQIIDLGVTADFLGKTAGHTAQLISRAEGPLTHVETAPGVNVVSIMEKRRGIKEKIKDLLHREKAA